MSDAGTGKRVVVLHHAPCPDGFTAAAVAARHYRRRGATVEVIGVAAGTPPQTPPGVEGADFVIMVDVCYNWGWMLAFAERVGFDRLAVLDHHPNAKDVLARLSDRQQKLMRGSPSFRYSDTDAACVMLWHYLYPCADVPLVLQYISDRDTGKYEMPHCKEVTASLIARNLFQPGGEAELIGLIEETGKRWVSVAKKHGKQVVATQAQQCIQAVRDAKLCQWILPAKTHVVAAVIIMPQWELWTQITNLVAAAHPQVRCCMFPVPQDDCWKVSVRACRDFDTTVVTRAYPDGGGHMGAGSFTLPPGVDYQSCMRPL